MNATQTVSTGSGSFRPTGRTAGRKYCRSLAAVIGLMAVLTAVPALAVAYSDGTLDRTFGTGSVPTGTVETDIGAVTNDDAWAMALQNDGKIIVAGKTSTGSGDFAVVRYNTNGTLDTSFDSDGKATTDIGMNSIDFGYSVGIQNDGKIVVAGSTETAAANSQDVALVRYNADGSLDTTFDTDGKVTTDVGAGKNDSATSLVIQSDGKLVVAGLATTTGTNSDYAVVRYNADGSLDTTFDTDGKATINVGDIDDTAALALQSDGKLVVAGTTRTGTSGGNIAVARLLTDGSLDTTFDSDGKVSTDVGTGSDDYGRSIVIQSDGKIVVVGRTDSNSGDFVILRYSADGSLDTTFDSDGKVTTNFSQTSALNSNVVAYSFDSAFSGAIQNDGRIVVAGQTAMANFGIARYNADGSLDTSFGTSGKVSTSIYEGNYDIARSVAIQSDGKIVAAGYTDGERSGNIGNFGVARYGVTAATTTTVTTASSSLPNSAPSTTAAGSSPAAAAPSDSIINSLSIKNIVPSGTAQAGSSVSVNADGFTPSESVAVGVQGSKASVRSATADSRGAITAKVSIPSTAKGKVTIYAYGRTSKHGYRDTVTILKSETIPRTGTDLSVLALLGAMFLAVGLLVSAQRRIVR